MTTAQRPAGRDERAERDRGLVLVHGDSAAVVQWAERGLVAVYALALPEWVAVLPAGPLSRASSPYDAAVPVLAGRPLPAKLRPAVGLFAVNGRGVVTVQPHGWRPVQRWLVWSPSLGVVRTPRLPALRPGDLLRAAGTRPQQAGTSLLQVLRERQGRAVPWLVGLMGALGLPGTDLLTGERHPKASPDAVLVEPRTASLARFEAILRERADRRAELEEI